MPDDTFHQKNIQPEDVNSGESNKLSQDKLPADSPLKQVQDAQQAMATSESQTQITGRPPPQLQRAMARDTAQRGEATATQAPQQLRVTGSQELEQLLSQIQNNQIYEEVVLPSRGIFYDGQLPDGKINVRAMTGEEEQILATPRYVRSGQAINMIFKRCIQEQFPTEKMVTADRTYLLIFLRGISYSPEYEVEIKCPECSQRFTTVLDLNQAYVTFCPDDFGPGSLTGVLPETKFNFEYRMSVGSDEIDLQNHRERRIKQFGDSNDDTLSYRSSQLLVSIEGLTDKNELQTLVKRLPIMDVSHLRNTVNEPPFGVDTDMGIICPMCTAEFTVDLPMETNFFFPRRRKEEKTPA